jgi:hypothetical protein
MIQQPMWISSLTHLLSLAREFHELIPLNALFGPMQLVLKRTAAAAVIASLRFIMVPLLAPIGALAGILASDASARHVRLRKTAGAVDGPRRAADPACASTCRSGRAVRRSLMVAVIGGG